MLRHLLLIAIIVAICAIQAAPRSILASGGGDGGGTQPPWPSPATPHSPGDAPTLGPLSGRVVVRVVPLVSAPSRPAYRYVIRVGNRPIDTGWLPVDAPVMLPVPMGTAVSFDIIGTDAVAIPIADGQVIRVLAP